MWMGGSSRLGGRGGSLSRMVAGTAWEREDLMSGGGG